VLVNTHLRSGSRGRVRVVLRCPPALASCHGGVTLRTGLSVISGHGRHRHHHVVRVVLAHDNFGVHKGQFAITLQLGRRARALLRRHHGHLRVTLTIVLPGVSTRKVDALLSGPG
jgi:hypothetical protein